MKGSFGRKKATASTNVKAEHVRHSSITPSAPHEAASPPSKVAGSPHSSPATNASHSPASTLTAGSPPDAHMSSPESNLVEDTVRVQNVRSGAAGGPSVASVSSTKLSSPESASTVRRSRTSTSDSVDPTKLCLPMTRESSDCGAGLLSPGVIIPPQAAFGSGLSAGTSYAAAVGGRTLTKAVPSKSPASGSKARPRTTSDDAHLSIHIPTKAFGAGHDTHLSSTHATSNSSKASNSSHFNVHQSPSRRHKSLIAATPSTTQKGGRRHTDEAATPSTRMRAFTADTPSSKAILEAIAGTPSTHAVSKVVGSLDTPGTDWGHIDPTVGLEEEHSVPPMQRLISLDTVPEHVDGGKASPPPEAYQETTSHPQHFQQQYHPYQYPIQQQISNWSGMPFAHYGAPYYSAVPVAVPVPVVFPMPMVYHQYAHHPHMQPTPRLEFADAMPPAPVAAEPPKPLSTSATPFFPAAGLPPATAAVPMVSAPPAFHAAPHNADERMFRYLCDTLERSTTAAMEDWSALVKLVGRLCPSSATAALALAIEGMPLQVDDALTLELIAAIPKASGDELACLLSDRLAIEPLNSKLAGAFVDFCLATAKRKLSRDLLERSTFIQNCILHNKMLPTKKAQFMEVWITHVGLSDPYLTRFVTNLPTDAYAAFPTFALPCIQVLLRSAANRAFNVIFNVEPRKLRDSEGVQPITAADLEFMVMRGRKLGAAHSTHLQDAVKAAITELKAGLQTPLLLLGAVSDGENWYKPNLDFCASLANILTVFARLQQLLEAPPNHDDRLYLVMLHQLIKHSRAAVAGGKNRWKPAVIAVRHLVCCSLIETCMAPADRAAFHTARVDAIWEHFSTAFENASTDYKPFVLVELGRFYEIHRNVTDANVCYGLARSLLPSSPPFEGVVPPRVQDLMARLSPRGGTEPARQAKHNYWKVWLALMMSAYIQHCDAATVASIVQAALAQSGSRGRLWASAAQLQSKFEEPLLPDLTVDCDASIVIPPVLPSDPEVRIPSLVAGVPLTDVSSKALWYSAAIVSKALAQQALHKSGELWVEAARVQSHPLWPRFNVEEAQAHAGIALRVTPQNGDAKVERLRLALLAHRLSDVPVSEEVYSEVSPTTFGQLFHGMQAWHGESQWNTFEQTMARISTVLETAIAANATAYSAANKASPTVAGCGCTTTSGSSSVSSGKDVVPRFHWIHDSSLELLFSDVLNAAALLYDDDVQ